MSSRPDRLDVPTLAVSAGLAAWLWATIISNNPASKGFDRLRRRLPMATIVVPNWRFFAPNPAQHDNHLVYRLQLADGEFTDWRLVDTQTRRRWWKVFVHPGRRRTKSIGDLITMLLGTMASYPMATIEASGAYRLLRGFIHREIHRRPEDDGEHRGFQFAIVRYSGYDDEPDIEYVFVSSFVLHADVVPAAASR